MDDFSFQSLSFKWSCRRLCVWRIVCIDETNNHPYEKRRNTHGKRRVGNEWKRDTHMWKETHTETHICEKKHTMDFSLVWVMSEKSSREWCARSFTHKTYVSFHIDYVCLFIRMIFLFIYIRFLLRCALSLIKHRSLFQNIGLFSYVLGLFSYVQFLFSSIFGFSWGSCLNTSIYAVVSFPYVLGLFSYVQCLFSSVLGLFWGSCINTSIYAVVSFHIHWDSDHVWQVSFHMW